MSDAAATGARVLDALAQGRRRAIERKQADSRVLRELVGAAALRDERAGRQARGRAKRIALALHGMVTERGALKIISELEASRSDSPSHAPVSQPQGTD